MPTETDRTIVELCERAFAAHPASPLFHHRPSRVRAATLTYAEAAALVERLAAGLAAALPAGARLAIQGSPSPRLACLYLAAARARVILIPLDLRMSAEAIERIIELATPDAILLGPGATVDTLVVPALARLRVLDLDELAEREADPGPLAERGRPSADETFEIVFTSGTTGSPKGVVLSHRNLLASVARMHATVPERAHRMVSILPLSHIMEQVGGLLYVLDTGSSTEYLGSLRPDVLAASVAENRVTALVCVPQLLALLADQIGREAERTGRARRLRVAMAIARVLPHPLRRRLFRDIHARLGGELELVVSAAAYLPPVLQGFWERLGLTVLQGYGATEAGLLTTTRPGKAPAGSVGWAQPPVELRIAPDGEILARGPSVTQGYDRNPEATAAAFTEDGWYRTGDAGRLGADGRLTLIGRTRTMFVLPNGMNVFPEDIEQVFADEGFAEPVAFEAEPGRLEIAVIAGRIMRAGFADDETSVSAAMKRANRRLGDAQRVGAWRVYPDADFPRTHTLKVQRARLTERMRGA